MFKIKEGTIRNLNKKIVTGALVTTLIMTGLTGCNKTGFSYEKKSQEQVLVTGSEEYSIVSSYLVAEIEIEGEKKLYIIEPYYDLKNENILNCKDVFTGENLISIDLEKRKVLDDKKMYYTAELPKPNSERCFGIVTDKVQLAIFEYSKDGADAELIIWKRI